MGMDGTCGIGGSCGVEVTSSRIQSRFKFRFQPVTGAMKLLISPKSMAGIAGGARGVLGAGELGGCDAGAVPPARIEPNAWFVELEFAAVAPAEFPFVCTTTGLLPGLFTTIGVAMLAGCTCAAFACAPAPWAV